MRRIVSYGALVASILAMGSACAPERSSHEAELSLTGRVRVAPASGKAITVSTGRTVGLGDTVRVIQGAATIAFSDDRRIELREGGAIKLDRVPTLLTGDALVVAGATRFVVEAAGSSLALTGGAARVGRQLGLQAATYEGTLTITSAGHRLEVPALRQATVPSLGVLPAKVEPLQIHGTDAWDRRFLGDAIELNEQLQARSDGLTGQLPAGEGRTATFIANLVPALDSAADVLPSLVNGARPPGETVVGASIAVAGKAGSLADRWRGAFAFRDEGAAWGLVAVDQRVTDVVALSSILDRALSRAESFTIQETVAALALPLPVQVPGVTKPPAASGGGTPSTTAPRQGTSTTQPPAGATPDEVPPAGPLEGVVVELGDTVDGLVGGLLGALKNRR